MQRHLELKIEANNLLKIAADHDKAFSEALKAAYGKQAGDMRYWTQKQTPEIKALGETYKTAIEKWRTAYQAIPQD